MKADRHEYSWELCQNQGPARWHLAAADGEEERAAAAGDRGVELGHRGCEGFARAARLAHDPLCALQLGPQAALLRGAGGGRLRIRVADCSGRTPRCSQVSGAVGRAADVRVSEQYSKDTCMHALGQAHVLL